MLIGVDEEGGTVTRISRYPAFRAEPFASPQELYQAGGLEAVAQDTEEKCELLESLGVNVNFAPSAMSRRIRLTLSMSGASDRTRSLRRSM